MTAAKSPTAYRVLLGRELRALRTDSGLDRPEIIKTLGWDGSKLSRFEAGTAIPRVTELDELLKLYNASPEAAERIREVGVHARKRGRHGKVPDWSRQYFGLESDAVELAIHQGELIPGLFQTEAYARALISTSVTVSPVDVESMVQTRIRRQSLLTESNAPKVHLVLGEAAIHREVGGKDALIEQLDRLIEAAKLPNVVLQVLPFTTGAHAAIGPGFTLLTLELEGSPARWVYLEDLSRGECRSDDQPVRTYAMTFDSLVINALGEAETLNVLKRRKSELKGRRDGT
ncbi:helix-turn-helix domain-containing protein [Amycolatopsis sp. NPDC004368]